MKCWEAMDNSQPWLHHEIIHSHLVKFFTCCFDTNFCVKLCKFNAQINFSDFIVYNHPRPCEWISWNVSFLFPWFCYALIVWITFDNVRIPFRFSRQITTIMYTSLVLMFFSLFSNFINEKYQWWSSRKKFISLTSLGFYGVFTWVSLFHYHVVENIDEFSHFKTYWIITRPILRISASYCRNNLAVAFN